MNELYVKGKEEAINKLIEISKQMFEKDELDIMDVSPEIVPEGVFCKECLVSHEEDEHEFEIKCSYCDYPLSDQREEYGDERMKEN